MFPACGYVESTTLNWHCSKDYLEINWAMVRAPVQPRIADKAVVPYVVSLAGWHAALLMPALLLMPRALPQMYRALERMPRTLPQMYKPPTQASCWE